MRTTVDRILITILRVGLILILLVPLSYDGTFLFPFIIPRAIFFQVLIDILFVIAVFVAVFFPQYRPRLSLLAKALILFFGVSLLTTITSADPMKSFIGTIERSFGFFHIVHYLAFFFILLVALRERTARMIFLWCAVAVSFYAALDFLIPSFQNPQQPPMSAMGNQTFLAGYLIFHIFFAIYLGLQTKNRWVQGILAAVVLIESFTIVNTGVRGAILGLTAGALCMFGYAVWKLPKLRTACLVFIAVVAVCYSLIFINREDPLLQHNSMVQKITNFSLRDATIVSRFSMWRMAYAGWKARPLVGWGRENFSLVFNLYFDSAFQNAGVAEGWEDRAHNLVFDELVNGGFLELLAYALLLYAALCTILRSKSTAGHRSHETALLVSLLVSYVVQALFGVETLNTYIPFFIFLGCIELFAHGEHEASSHAALPKQYAIPIIGIALIVSSASLYLSFQTARGNMTMFDAMRSIFSNNAQAFTTSFERSKESLRLFPTMRSEAVTTVSTVLLQNSESLFRAGTYFSFGLPFISELESFHKLEPDEQRFTFVLGKLLMIAAVSGDFSYLDRADVIWGELHDASPERDIFKESILQSQQIRNLLNRTKVQKK